jgi:CubicO group peptidase (beta-lactamase class C family)
LTVAVVSAPTGQPVIPARARSDAEIRGILADRIDRFKQSAGIVVGIIDPDGRRVVSYGVANREGAAPVTPDTLFETGSITKVFTALLLSDMVKRGEVALTDPVAKYLPDSVRVPERRGRQITLLDLATHTSGLPREATNLRAVDQDRPYDNYSADDLYAFLSDYKLERDIGVKYEYSNVGAAVLGHALARRMGTSYEALVRTRILEPLGMNDSGVNLQPAERRQLATGYRFVSFGLEPSPNWTMGAYEAAGALRSTADDMLTFLSAALGYTPNPLAKEMAAMLETLRPAGLEESGVKKAGLGWHILSPRACMFMCVSEGDSLVIHDGRTGGYQSFVGYDPDARIGVVILSNAGYGAGVADIGLHLLNPKLPLLSGKALDLPKVRVQIALDPSILESCVGRYQFPDDQDIWTIRRDGGRLLASHKNDPETEIFAQTSATFFFKVGDAQVTFEKAGNRVTGLVLQDRHSKDRRARKIE